jgi:hypothetical protein
MSSDLDIYQILESLDAAQKSVKQLPALFKPANTSPQLSGVYPGKNATLGYMVGEGEEESLDNMTSMGRAVSYRIANQHPEWFMKYGLDAVKQAIHDATSGEDDWEEIGSSDVSAYVSMVGDSLRDHYSGREEMDDRRPFAEEIVAEATATEDVISTMKKKLGDYLQDVATAIKTDPDLKDKIPQSIDQISAVKTITTDDGHEIKILGNEDDGFRISIKNRDAKTTFRDLDEATMAVEMYCARRRQAAESADYIEEKR